VAASARAKARPWRGWKKRPGLTTDMTFSWTARCRTTAARAKIRRALALGRSVTVVHVHREFAETVRMVVKRAIEMGRAVMLDNIAVTHFRSRETLFKLAQEFGERINIRVVENSGDETGTGHFPGGIGKQTRREG
jgi:hypothetical protein